MSSPLTPPSASPSPSTQHLPTLKRRDAPPRVVWALEQAGVPPLLARLFAGRGVRHIDELDDALGKLLAPSTLCGTDAAARLLADAIANRQRICIVADYDCDGATACAVALRGLALLGAERANLGYVVPDRAVHGYGLTPAIVDLAMAHRPQVLMTVDNGIASLDGVAHARALGLQVLVTDHHLPALVGNDVVLPDASVIVNPNQPACGFASKSIAGVGVAFYVLLALRSELRSRGVFDASNQPRLDALLDLVALGTVADVVKLDANNRRLVAQGLKRMRGGHLQPGVAALFAAAGRDARRASAGDLGFAIGPRINAAGRLSDMTLGIECLTTDDAVRARELATMLDGINRERRTIEGGMNDQAALLLATLLKDESPTADASTPSAIALFDPGFHEGVVGIVASRMKERLHRPTFVFARGQDGLLKGSGRSIAGFHLRDALDLISKRHPSLLRRFGGHAMAAGCTIEADGFDTFAAGLQRVATEWLDAATLTRTLLGDGPLAAEHFNPATVRVLDAQVWGQAFEAPLFSAEADVVSQRRVGERHMKLALRIDGVVRDAIWFGRSEPVDERVQVAYRLQVDEYNGHERLQLVIESAV